MEIYAKTLSYAIPAFFILIIIEAIAARIRGMHINRDMDVITSLSSGLTNMLQKLAGLSIVLISYKFMVEHIALTEIKSTPLIFILTFIGIDFMGYWGHRLDHIVNIFWNRHVIHHSSEEFNLSCALRQSISDTVQVYFFLYIPMALLGLPFKVIAIMVPLHHFAQFWYHTRVIKKMGFLEYIIVTPSHHRVHHAINPEYIDKNFSEVLIIWDKLFGTFQKELDDKPPVYGTLKPVDTWNPIIINFLHMWHLIKDAWHARSWWDKTRIWFMPTGWRPADVREKYPVYTIQNVYKREKYGLHVSSHLKIWSWFQLIVNNSLIYYLLINFNDPNKLYVTMFVAWIFVSIFAYTSLMDGHRIALFFEIIKISGGLFILWSGTYHGWLGLLNISSLGVQLLLFYILLSLGGTLYFLFVEKEKIITKLEPSTLVSK